MSTSCETVALSQDTYDRWNRLAAASDDAWFWQTSHWLDWAREFGRTNMIADLSFFIQERAETVAICPLIVEETADGRQFGFCNGPLPMPALNSSLEPSRRYKVLGCYLTTLARLAEAHNVSYVRIKVPSLAKSYLNVPRPMANPLTRFGFFDLPALTQILDLRVDQSILWSGIRKGHKADIKRAQRECRVQVWDRGTITPVKFSEYQALHRKDAGCMTRSQATFDMMHDWIRRDLAVLIEAEHGGQAVAFALLLLYKEGAYYGSGCKDPDHAELPTSHLVQWEAIQWLKAHGYQFYDIGVQQFGPQWYEVPTPKEITIAHFKRGFGGHTLPLVTGEFFYSAELLEKTFERRIQAYLATRLHVGAES